MEKITIEQNAETLALPLYARELSTERYAYDESDDTKEQANTVRLTLIFN